MFLSSSTIVAFASLTLCACNADALPSGSTWRYAINHITLPQGQSDFAIDLNGDGRPDNQFGNIIGALKPQRIDAQASMDTAIRTGRNNELLSLITRVPALQNDVVAGATAYAGLDGAPDFSGKGMFAIDDAVAPADFAGPVISGSFTSENPLTTINPTTMRLRLSLLEMFMAGQLFPLTLHGTHISFQTATDATSGVPGLIQGQVHGSIKRSDLDKTLIPALAASLTQWVQANPNARETSPLLAVFDHGHCTNPDGTMANADDRIIDICEVATNSIIINTLAPDIQIYDTNGNYAPNKDNRIRDSISVGVGFTAVRAIF